MSGLHFEITVVSHDAAALEDVLNIPYEKTTYGREFFSSSRYSFFQAPSYICQEKEFPCLKYICTPDSYKIDDWYYTTLKPIMDALQNRGIIYAKGSHEGSGEYGAILIGWNEIVCYNAKEDARILADGKIPVRATKGDFENGSIRRYTLSHLFQYYTKHLPDELAAGFEQVQTDYQEEQRKKEQAKLEEWQNMLATYTNQISEMMIDPDTEIEFSNKRISNAFLQYYKCFAPMVKNIGLLGGRVSTVTYKPDYYLVMPVEKILPETSGETFDQAFSELKGVVEKQNSMPEILSANPHMKFISLDMLEKALSKQEIPPELGPVQFDNKKKGLLKASSYHHIYYKSVSKYALRKAMDTVADPEEVDPVRNTCKFTSLSSGDVYHTSLTGCTCPAYKKELRVCKHMVRLALWLGYPVSQEICLLPDETIEMAAERIRNENKK